MGSDVPDEVDRPGTALSLGRALRLLDTFGGMGNVFGVSELARRVGLPKSTVFRLLTQLVESGYVTRLGTGYRLSLHTFSIGNRFAHARAQGLRELAAPHLGELFLTTRFSVTIGVLDETEVVLLDAIQSMRAAGPDYPVVGDRRPPTTTAVGKALLAFSRPEATQAALALPLSRSTERSITTVKELYTELVSVRTHGVAFEIEEERPGIVGVAAPVLVDGWQRAAVGVQGPVGQFDPHSVVELVQATARGVAVGFVRDRKRADLL